MKNSLNELFLVLILVAATTLNLSAHGGHEHEEEPSLISNHALTGIWTVKQTFDNESLKFHMGHEHAPKPMVVLKLDLCGNGETLVGKVEQIKLIDAPKKLNVVSATTSNVGEVPEEGFGLTEYTILLNSLRNNDVAVTMISTTTDIAGQMTINFDNGDTSYTAARKKSKASTQCLELLNNQDE